MKWIKWGKKHTVELFPFERKRIFVEIGKLVKKYPDIEFTLIPYVKSKSAKKDQITYGYSEFGVQIYSQTKLLLDMLFVRDDFLLGGEWEFSWERGQRDEAESLAYTQIIALYIRALAKKNYEHVPSVFIKNSINS